MRKKQVIFANRVEMIEVNIRQKNVKAIRKKVEWHYANIIVHIND